MPKQSCWVEANDSLLLSWRKDKIPIRIIADELGVTVDVVWYRLRKLDAPRRRRFSWTPECDAKVLEVYSNPGRPPHGSVKKLAWEIGKLPPSALYQRIRFLRNKAAK